MSDPLTLADFAPAIAGLIALLMCVAGAWHATRGTRALRRRRREQATRGAIAGDGGAEAGDLARARALADALVRVLHAAERKAPGARAAE